MIAFIEGGMRIHMGKVTRDFLSLFRLCPTQCAPNLFRVLGSVKIVKRQDITFFEKDMGYYLKTRVPTIKLISCLPKTNKGIDKDFLIVLGEWHDRLHCPTKDGTPSGVA